MVDPSDVVAGTGVGDGVGVGVGACVGGAVVAVGVELEVVLVPPPQPARTRVAITAIRKNVQKYFVRLVDFDSSFLMRKLSPLVTHAQKVGFRSDTPATDKEPCSCIYIPKFVAWLWT